MKITREIVETTKDVRVALDWLYPKEYFSATQFNKRAPKIVVVICPGLNSDTNNGYIRSFLDSLRKLNDSPNNHDHESSSSTVINLVDAVVVNQRGYSGVPLKKDQPMMCAALTDDLRAVTYRHLTPSALKKRYNCEEAPVLVTCGFSMGSNIMSKFLAEEGEKVAINQSQPNDNNNEENTSSSGENTTSPRNHLESKLKKIASLSPTRSGNASSSAFVSPSPSSAVVVEDDGRETEETERPQILCAFGVGCPWSLPLAIRTLAVFPGFIYESSFLDGLRGMIANNFDDSSSPYINTRGVRSEIAVIDYDENHIAPLHGFKSAAHYYASAQAFDRLDTVGVPLFVLSALEDPICGLARLDEQWHRVACEENSNVVYCRVPSGGHLGSLGFPVDEWEGKAAPMDRIVVEKMLKPILMKM